MTSLENSKFVKVASVDQVPEGKVFGVTVGEKRLVLCRFGGEFHALDGVCSHAKGPLHRGQLDGQYLICPWHGWEYDVVTGICELEPTLRQEKYPLRIEGDDIWVQVSS